MQSEPLEPEKREDTPLSEAGDAPGVPARPEHVTPEKGDVPVAEDESTVEPQQPQVTSSKVNGAVEPVHGTGPAQPARPATELFRRPPAATQPPVAPERPGTAFASSPADRPAPSYMAGAAGPSSPSDPQPHFGSPPTAPSSTTPSRVDVTATSPVGADPAQRAEQPAPAAQAATARKEPAKITAGPEKPKGLLDLAPTERLVREVDSGDDGRFVLTSTRLIYQGRSADGALFAAASVSDVTSIEFGRRPRDSRSAWWGTIGLIAAIAVWQVTTNETVGAVAGAVVAGISLLLLADYWFRPPGLVLRFGTPGGAVEGAVSGKRVHDAEQLAAEVQQLRSSGSGAASRSSGRPPGGSPGL